MSKDIFAEGTIWGQYCTKEREVGPALHLILIGKNDEIISRITMPLADFEKQFAKVSGKAGFYLRKVTICGKQGKKILYEQLDLDGNTLSAAKILNQDDFAKNYFPLAAEPG